MTRTYPCPNCTHIAQSSKTLMRHLLEEAGPRGVTTGDLLRAGVGSRYGARKHELCHRDGCVIREVRERDGSHRYFLDEPGVSSAPAPARSPSPEPSGAAVTPPGVGADETSGLFDMPPDQPDFDSLVPPIYRDAA